MTVVNPRAEEHVGELRVEQVIRLPLGEVPLGLSEVDVGIPEAGSDDAMVARQEGGAWRDGDLGADGGDEAVAEDKGAVVDGGIVGRSVDARVLEDESLVGEAKGQVRSVAWKDLEDPEGAARKDEEGKKRKKETKRPAAHGDLTRFNHIRRRGAGSSSQRCRLTGPVWV